jgi:hypothetical protein
MKCAEETTLSSKNMKLNNVGSSTNMFQADVTVAEELEDATQLIRKSIIGHHP